MARARVVVEGNDELREQLEHIVGGLDDLREVGTEAAALLATRAWQQAPYDTGSLRDDIRTFAAKRNAGVRVGRARIPWAGPGVGGHGSPAAPRPQGGYMLPNPWIFDPLDERRTQIVDLHTEFIDGLIAGDNPKAAQRYRVHTYE